MAHVAAIAWAWSLAQELLYVAGAAKTKQATPQKKQAGKNRIVFETLYKSRETNDYNGKRIGNLLNACGLPVGESKDTISEVCEFCKGAYLLVGIGTRNNEYLGKNENYVKFYGKTKNGSKASTLSTEPKQEEEISDDMLPF